MATIKGYLTTKEVADRWGVHYSYVCRLVQEGRLKATRAGATLLVEAESLRQFKRMPRGRPRKPKAAGVAKGKKEGQRPEGRGSKSRAEAKPKQKGAEK